MGVLRRQGVFEMHLASIGGRVGGEKRICMMKRSYGFGTRDIDGGCVVLDTGIGVRYQLSF